MAPDDPTAFGVVWVCAARWLWYAYAGLSAPLLRRERRISLVSAVKELCVRLAYALCTPCIRRWLTGLGGIWGEAWIRLTEASLHWNARLGLIRHWNPRQCSVHRTQRRGKHQNAHEACPEARPQHTGRRTQVPRIRRNEAAVPLPGNWDAGFHTFPTFHTFHEHSSTLVEKDGTDAWFGNKQASQASAACAAVTACATAVPLCRWSSEHTHSHDAGWPKLRSA